MINKISDRRWRNFKKNKKAFYSGIIFLFLFLLSLCAEFIANDKPLLVIYKGKYYAPAFKFYSEKEFGGDLRTEALYKDIEVQCLIVSGGDINCWDRPSEIIRKYNQANAKTEFKKGKIYWAIIRYKHNTIANLDEPAPSPPSLEHILGTDDTARDVLARVIYGFRVSVIFGLLVTIFASAIGVLVGALQGYYGGKTDLFGQRIIEIWTAVPSLYVIIIISAFLKIDFIMLVLLLTLFSWTALVGVVRAEILRARNFDYVVAAKALGVSSTTIIFKHLLPNAMVATLTLIPFILTGAIGSLAALDFLGFGLPASYPSLGELTMQAKQNLQAPWLGLSAFFVFSLMLGLLVFIFEGVRDAFDPRKIFA
jgi:microcin C transport system permease protein